MPSSSITNAARRVPMHGRRHAVRACHLVVDVGQQRHGQPVVLGERLVGLEALVGDPDDRRVERAHVVGAVAIGAELLRADHGLVAGVEEQHHPLARGARRAGRRRRCPPARSPGRGRRRVVQRPSRERVRQPWIPGSQSTPPPSPPAPSASSRRWWRSRRPAATCTAPRRPSRSSRRWRPTRRRSSASPCSSPDHAADLILRLTGSGIRRLLLLGHLDTVVAHDEHRPLTREGEQLVGSGAIDMKGGDVLALGVLRALATRAERLRRGRAAARVRRGVARRALRPRPALRGLRRLPVLRGRAAGRRRPRGRGRPPQGGRHAERDRARAQRALGLGAREGDQRAAGAGLGGAGGRGQPGSARARSG